MQVASFPKMEDKSQNPYLYLLRKGLLNDRVEICETNQNSLSSLWLWKNKSKVKLLHFHWIQYHYVNIEKRRVSFKKIFNFCWNILFARIIGYKIVWTMHNIKPHENIFPKTDRRIRKLLFLLSHAVITHCEFARDYVKDQYSRDRNVFVIQHPNYIGFYPVRTPEKEVRKKLGIPEKALVFLYLGEIRFYKGLDRLIQAFQEYSNPDACLIIAGNPLFPEIKTQLQPLIEADNRIKPHLYFIPEDHIELFYQASDAVFFPFTDITMSGSLLLAMSFAKAVVAPSIGGIPEVVNASNGILYGPDERKGLLDAMVRCENADLEYLGKAAYQSILPNTWDDFAQRINKVYRGLKDKRSA